MLNEWLDVLAEILLVVGYLAVAIITSVCLYHFLAVLLMACFQK